MTQIPIATVCINPEQQNSVFDMRITGISDFTSMRNLRTHMVAAGYVWLDADREASDTCVCQIGCASDSILETQDVLRIVSAIQSAGMQIAVSNLKPAGITSLPAFSFLYKNKNYGSIVAMLAWGKH